LKCLVSVRASPTLFLTAGKLDLTNHVITLWQLQYYLVLTQNPDKVRPLSFCFFTLTGCVISTFMRKLMSFVIIDES
jgi:hypothetical protein